MIAPRRAIKSEQRNEDGEGRNHKHNAHGLPQHSFGAELAALRGRQRLLAASDITHNAADHAEQLQKAKENGGSALVEPRHA